MIATQGRSQGSLAPTPPPPPHHHFLRKKKQKQKKISDNFFFQLSLYRRCSDLFCTCKPANSFPGFSPTRSCGAREGVGENPLSEPSQLHSRSNGTVSRKYRTHLWHVFNGLNPRYERFLFQHLTRLTTKESTVCQSYVMATVMVPTWTFFVPGAGLCLFSHTNCASSAQRLRHWMQPVTLFS